MESRINKLEIVLRSINTSSRGVKLPNISCISEKVILCNDVPQIIDISEPSTYDSLDLN